MSGLANAAGGRPVPLTSAVDNPYGYQPWPKKKAAIVLISLVVALVAISIVGGNVALVFCLLIALMLTGIPVSIALGLTVLMFLFLLTAVPVEAVALKLFTGIEKFEIMAIPFFILAGGFLTHGGVARRMIKFATTLVGHWHGGLALAGIIACAMFALVCGSSVATVVAIGSIILPAMVKQGYPMKFGAGVIITAGSLGILMLPSIPKVIYAISTGTSIGALFVAGLFPGMLLTAMLCGTTWFLAKRNGYPRMKKATWRQKWQAFRDSVWGLALVVIIIGGIYTGIFTATEAAAMSAVYAFIISVFVYKDMPLSKTPQVLLTSAALSAMLLYIITNATLFSFLMAHENIPQQMADWMLGKNLGQIEFLAIVNVLLLLAGNVMEPSSIILVFAPILHPTAIRLGIDSVHFGILIDANMEVGLCHPPVGLNLYVASGISKLSITELAVAVLPWLGTMIVFLLIVTYWPDLSLWLPRHMGMMK
jgi:C4-dicarboxylate transporter DctM subunit